MKAYGIPDPAWNTDPVAALQEIERRVAETGLLWSSSGCFRALDRLPRNLGAVTSDWVGLENTAVSDIAGLSALPGTRVLLVGPAVADISVVAGLPALERFEGQAISDIRPLRHCLRLKDLKLNVQGLADLAPLAELGALEQLQLSGYAGQPLPPMPTLLRLFVRGALGTEIDLSPLEAARGLRTISTLFGPLPTALPRQLPQLDTLFASFARLGSLQVVSGFPKLRDLLAKDLPSTDLVPLTGCQALETLDVSDSGVQDIGPLLGLAALERINMSRTAVEDVVPLSRLPRLRSLDASDSRVASLHGWDKASPLVRLNLSRTAVASVQPLAGTALQELYLRETPMASLEGLSSMPHLRVLDVSGTQVNSLADILANRMLIWSDPQPKAEGGSLYFSNTPATRRDPTLAAIAAGGDVQAALRAHFGLEPAMQPAASVKQGPWSRLLGRLRRW